MESFNDALKQRNLEKIRAFPKSDLQANLQPQFHIRCNFSLCRGKRFNQFVNIIMKIIRMSIGRRIGQYPSKRFDGQMIGR